MTFSRKSKYGNKRTIVDGVTFASKREAKRWTELKLLERGGAIISLMRQVAYDLVVNEMRICRYIADFTYWEGAALVVEDCKGFRTPEYKLKVKLMRACHGITIKET